MPPWSQKLRGLYWELRAKRIGSRRSLYRHIRKERTRLLQAGICPFQLHTVCRVLANPRSETAQARMRRALIEHDV